jgi:hypothetical protein
MPDFHADDKAVRVGFIEETAKIAVNTVIRDHP